MVLTNFVRSGLQKNGHIYLNLNQVFEEWLYVLASAKKDTKLCHEICQMEIYLSKILKQIKVCDNLDKLSLANIDDDRSIILSASYYHKILNQILNNFTADINEIDCLINENKLSHLHLTLQK